MKTVRLRIELLAVTALGLAGASQVSAMTFLDNFGGTVKPIGTALGRSIGSTLPVISASPGVVYTFNLETGVPKREAAVLGQLFVERAETLGRHKWNLSLSYQRVKIDTLNGDDIGKLHDTTPIIDPKDPMHPFTIPLFGVELDTHEFTASATLGVTDDLDINVTVPVLYSEFAFTARFGLQKIQPRFVRSTKLGFGDIFLRGKYRLLDADWARLAIGGVLRVPSGNEENFQGTGAVEVAPMLYASSRSVHAARSIDLQAFLNAGFDFNADDVDRSEPRYGVGLDCRLGEGLTAAVAVLGHHALRRIARAGSFDVDRPGGRESPLFGIRDRRPDFYDISIGGRVNLWRDTLIGFVNAIVPLNTDGLRAEVIPLAGVEATF